MRHIVILMGWLAFASPINADFCQVKMTSPNGKQMYPPEEILPYEPSSYFKIGVDTETQCIYYMELERVTEMQFMFTNINLTDYEAIQVLASESEKNPWITIEWIEYYQEEATITIKNAKFIKLVFAQETGYFEVAYAEKHCQEPDSRFKQLACTQHYSTNSHCIFECEDGYLPLKLGNPRFYAQCRTENDKGEWSMDVFRYCTDIKIISAICLHELIDGFCPYSIKDVAKIYGEDAELGEQEPNFEELDKLLSPRKPSVGRRFLNLGPPLKNPKKKCKYHCLIKKSTKKHFYKCGVFKEGDGRLLDCMKCRYGAPKPYCKTGSTIV